jgi:PHD/YefM family antitoxin component YafN of YafNO toxin-antitoxin module
MLNIVEDIKSLSFFKQKTGDVIKHIKSTKKPTFLTINGNVELVIQDAESYQKMIDDMNVAKILNALDCVKKGDVVQLEEGLEKIRKKHKIK